jgi:hypothetical protein
VPVYHTHVPLYHTAWKRLIDESLRAPLHALQQMGRLHGMAWPHGCLPARTDVHSR